MTDLGLRAGDIGFSTIGGRTGALVNLGQALLRDACRYTHAYLMVGTATAVEAMPAGARWVSTNDRVGSDFCYIRLPLTDVQRERVIMVADEMIGTPYSFVDYLALAAVQWRLPGRAGLRNYVRRSDRMICSQLVDHVLTEAGFHLFDDGRWPQDVTPGDLYYQAMRLGHRVG